MNIEEMSLEELLSDFLNKICVFQAKNNPHEYKAEILTRFKDLDSALTEAVNLNTKWCKEVADLQQQLENLKCCGNCKNWKLAELCKAKYLNGYCSNYQPNNLTRKERGSNGKVE